MILKIEIIRLKPKKDEKKLEKNVQNRFKIKKYRQHSAFEKTRVPRTTAGPASSSSLFGLISVLFSNLENSIKNHDFDAKYIKKRLEIEV